jgi:hypothetical protein
MKSRVLTIMARFGTDHYAGADSRIRAILAATCPQTDCHMLIVDNALDKGFESELSPFTRLIGGEGCAREFSAWDRAIAHLGRGITTYDVVHFATAAFEQLYVRYINSFDDRVIRLIADRAIAVGHIDYYPHPIAIFGAVSQHWLRSSYMFVAPRELQMLGRMAGADRAALFGGTVEHPFRADAPISQGYRKLIVDWLTSEMGTGQGTAWHSRFELTQKTHGLFEDKALAIVNEHLLSIRLRSLGCRTVDVIWLSTMLNGGGLPDEVPGWRQQLASRAFDASEPPQPQAWH